MEALGDIVITIELMFWIKDKANILIKPRGLLLIWIKNQAIEKNIENNRKGVISA